MIPNWLAALIVWITAISTILAFTKLCFVWMKKQLEKWILNEVILNIENRISKIEGWNYSQQEDINTLFDEKLIIITSIQAVLNGMKEQGANGPISKGIKDIEEYLLKKSAIMRSKKNLDR